MQPAPTVMPAPSSAPAVITPAPSSPMGEPEVISPVVIQGQPLPPVSAAPPAPVSAPAPVSGPAPSLQPAMITSENPPSISGPVTSDTLVKGFANNVPLAVALRQMLPAGYGFSVDPDVDMGTLVSYRGGQPWRETLRDMLDPAALTMHEEGQMVVISHASGNARPNVQPISNYGGGHIESSPPVPVSTRVISSPSSSAEHYLEPPPGAMPASSIVPLPMAAPSAAAAVDTWTANRSDSLRKILQDWCRRAGVEFEWIAEYDYPIQASLSFTGTFEEAVRGLLGGFEGAHPQPVAELHQNPNAGQMVLIVQTRGNNYSD